MITVNSCPYSLSVVLVRSINLKHVTKSSNLTSYPGLPFFIFFIDYDTWQQKSGIHPNHMSGFPAAQAGFLYFVNIWGPAQWLSTLMWSLLHHLNVDPTLHIHIVSNCHHSNDECSKAFPTLPFPCILLNANWRTKKLGRAGSEDTYNNGFGCNSEQLYFCFTRSPHKEEYNIARFTPFYCCIHCVANCLCTVFFLLFSPECCMPLWTTVVLLRNVQAHTSLWRTLSVALWGEMATRFVE